MWFVISKVLWSALQPSSLIAGLLVAGALIAPWRRLGLKLMIAGTAAYVILGVSPVANWLTAPLENWVRPARPEDMRGLAGIIVLGGALDTTVSRLRAQPQLNEAAERMTEAARLAGVYPDLPVIFSGGKAEFIYDELSESEVAMRFFEPFNLAPPRLKLETRSRNTVENAKFTAEMLKPTGNQRWLLITSAFHMPRSKALFEANGFQIVPWPVDYRTRGKIDRWRFFPQPSEGLRRMDLAAKEWVSLFVSRIRGDLKWPAREPQNPFAR